MKSNNASTFEIMRFLVVGGVAVIIDGCFYFCFINWEIFEASWAKRLSFMFGSIWVFFMNKYFTFRQKKLSYMEPILFGLVYVAGFFLNSFFHDFVFVFTKIDWLSFSLATSVSTISNFLGQKWIVFKSW